ncbi:MAG: HEAT repeat domain-containing protein [Cyanothece sp. SIO2G6]|nr:HEAT repeat domain-containing protein [Cyanothece sp. SIO2G6]
MSQDALFDQLKHPNPHLRDRAMWDLAEQHDDTTIDRLIDNLAEEDVVYRRASVKTLGAIGIKTVTPLIKIALHSENVTARASAVKALTQVVVMHPDTPFPPHGMDALKTALHDPNPVVYVATVMTLGEMGSPAFEILADALKTTDNVALAVAIVNAMPSMGDDHRAKTVLEGCIQDEDVDPYVQEMAASAMSRLELIAKNQPA